MKIFYYMTLSALAVALMAQQEGTSIELHVSARVVDQIQVITLSDIDAGIILPGQEEKRISPITDGGAGALLLEGQSYSSVQMTYSKQVTMTNLETSQPLIMNYMVSGSVEDNQSQSELFTTNPANVTLNAEGSYFVWVGCWFSTLGLVPGQYDGDFLLEVDYN